MAPYEFRFPPGDLTEIAATRGRLLAASWALFSVGDTGMNRDKSCCWGLWFPKNIQGMTMVMHMKSSAVFWHKAEGQQKCVDSPDMKERESGK